MRVANVLGAWSLALRIILCVGLGLLYSQATLRAQSVVLTWNPSADPDVVGYKIYYGTASQNYTNVAVEGEVTNATISGLAYGTTYYFAATTYDDSGNESLYSNEATFSVPTPAVGSSTTLSSPTLNAVADVNVNENAPAQIINLSGITTSGSAANVITPQIVSGGGSSTVQVLATSSNPGIIPNPSVNYTSPKSTGTLTFQPVANVTGTTTVTVTVNNGQPSNNIVAQSFTVTVLPAGSGLPEITTQPTNIMIVVNRTFPFSVSAVGQAPLQYQWQFNGVDIPWGTGPTLMLTNITMAEAGNYSVKVSNSLGAAVSATGVLAVYQTTLSMVAAANTANATPETLSAPSTPGAFLTSVVKNGGQFSFVVTGINHTNYVVQVSSDLVNWVSLQTNASPFAFVDTNLNGSSQRFYRAYEMP
jgi:Fibronectin type III domain